MSKTAKLTRVLKFLAVLISVICLAAAIFRTVTADRYNSKLKDEFNSIQSDCPPIYFLDYAGKKPMHELVRILRLEDGLSPYTNNSSAFSEPVEYRFILKHDISFYNGPSTFEKPIVTIKKGTEIVLNSAFTDILSPPCSLPTYERGWRFAMIGAVLPEENELKDTLCVSEDDELPKVDLYKDFERYGGYMDLAYADYSPLTLNAFGFVRLNDLNRLWDDFKKEYSETEPTDTSLGETPVLRADFYLKEKGIYLSPDLLEPVWDWMNTLLILPAVICLVYILWSYFKRKLKRT